MSSLSGSGVLGRAAIGGLISVVVVSPWLFCQGETAMRARCEAPEYFGVCDPFVPGTIVAFLPNKGIRVASTWPGGPAGEAGICSGDEIVAVNGVPFSEEKISEFLRAVTSDMPTPIDLKIKRGDRELDFHVARVRESTLAALSQEKYAHLPFFPFGERLVTVPVDESSQELQAFRDFELGVGDHFGFKLAEGRWAPRGTPEDQLRRVAQILADPQAAGLLARLIPTGMCGIGCSFLVLRNPPQILTGLIEPASAAHRAGLFPGDELLEVDGHPLSGLDKKQLFELILKPEDRPQQLSLRIRRGTSDIKVGLETERLYALGYAMSVFGWSVRPRKATYVVGLQTVDAGGPGQAIVSGVTYPSPAFDAGLLVGDLILAVNGEPIVHVTHDQLSDLLNTNSPSPIALEISRLGRTIHSLLTPVTEAQAQAGIGRKVTANGPASLQCSEPTVAKETGKD